MPSLTQLGPEGSPEGVTFWSILDILGGEFPGNVAEREIWTPDVQNWPFFDPDLDPLRTQVRDGPLRGPNSRPRY
jgi:hypothetical protein